MSFAEIKKQIPALALHERLELAGLIAHLSRSEIAINTLDEGNLPHGIVADTNWVHIIAEPGAGTYARRPAPRRPEFTSVEKLDSGIILKWTGQGTLQEAQEVTGPWTTISNAASPYPLSSDAARRFFRIIVP